MYSGNQILAYAAKSLSIIFHPALIAVWLVLALMWQGVLFPGAAAHAKGWFVLVMALNTVVVPAACTFLLDRANFWRANPRAEVWRRILPLAVMLVCYIACMVMIRDVPMAYPIRKLLAAGIGCLLFGAGAVFIIQKMNMHMVAQGACVAYLGAATLSNAAGTEMLLLASVALASILASARLYLDMEDAAGTAVGFAGGFAVTMAVVFLM